MKTPKARMQSQITAADVMRSPVECVYIEDTIDDVAKMFVAKGVSAAPVIGTNGLPIGVITKSDITRYESNRFRFSARVRRRGDERSQEETFIDIHPGFHLEPGAETIREWVTLNIECVFPETRLQEILKKMLRSRIHHVFVRSKADNRIVGVVTTYDLTRYLDRTLGRRRRSLPR